MPDPGNPITSLYPQPPQQQKNSLLNDPAQLTQVIGQVNALRQFQGRTAAGQAAINALQPDGGIDLDSYTRALQSNPAIAPVGESAAANLAALRRAQIENDSANFKLTSGQGDAVRNVIGTMAADDTLTPDKITNAVVANSRFTNTPSSIYNSILESMPQTGGTKALQRWAAGIGNVALGVGGASERVAGPVGPDGQPTQITKGQANLAGIGSAAPGYATGLSPSQTTAAEATGTASAAQGVALGQTADGSPTRKAMLGNLETDLNSFTSGPGADWQKVAKAWVNRNVPMLPQGWQFDPKSIASQEAFTKQAEQLAQQQFAAIGGTGTDAKFGSAFRSNPNDALSQLGNQGIIRLLKGNEDAITAKNNAWQDWLAAGHAPDTYGQFSRRFNQSYDPRVFQAAYMSKDDFTKMLKSMSPKEQREFTARLKSSVLNKYTSGPGSAYGGQ